MFQLNNCVNITATQNVLAFGDCSRYDSDCQKDLLIGLVHCPHFITCMEEGCE